MFNGLGRWAPLTGVVFALLFFFGALISGNTPDSDASPQKVVSYYLGHRNGQHASFYLIAYSIVFGLFFAGALRAYLRARGSEDGLVAVGFAGMVVLGVSAAVVAGMSFAAADVPGKISPVAEQAVSVLSNDVFVGMLIGTCVFMIGFGLAIVRSAAVVLPRWLGWVALPLGVIAATPIGWFVLIFALPLWSLIVSVLMLIRQESSATSAAAPATG
jgi:hypothetical protein